MEAVTSLYTDGADPTITSILARASDGSGYDATALDLREEEIVLETDRYRIVGKLTLPREGYRSRLSDYVNQRDREFFALSDVTISELDGATEPQARPFLMVARAHVQLIGIAGES